MSKLNKNEKRLIYILLVVIIVVAGGNYILLPAFNEKNTKSDELSSLEATYSTLKDSQIDYGDLDAKIKKSNEEYNALADKYLSLMQLEDVDKTFTSLAGEFLLTPISLEMNEIEAKSVKAYGEKSDEETTTEEKDTKTESGPTMMCATFTQTLSGNQTSFEYYIEAIKLLNSVEINSIQYGSDNTFIIKCSAYMLNK